MAKRTFVCRAGLTRNYGKHEVYYELSEQVEAEDSQEVHTAFLALQSILEEQIRVYEAVSLPYVKLADQTGTGVGADNSASLFSLETIKVENVDGKRRVKACGGQYIKHGVPVYEECSTDLPIETLGYGIHDFRNLNLKAKVDIVDGKPKRVVSIS